MKALFALVLLAAVACARPREDMGADSNALPAIDTLKPAPTDTLANRDTLATKATKATKATAGTPASTAVAKKPGTAPNSTKRPPAAAMDTTKLGRDVAIPLDPTKPRLPIVDTTKKKPPLSS